MNEQPTGGERKGGSEMTEARTISFPLPNEKGEVVVWLTNGPNGFHARISVFVGNEEAKFSAEPKEAEAIAEALWYGV